MQPLRELQGWNWEAAAIGPEQAKEGTIDIHAVKSHRQTEKELEVREVLAVGFHLANRKLSRVKNTSGSIYYYTKCLYN